MHTTFHHPAWQVKLGTEGVDTIYPVGRINDYEAQLLKSMMPELMSSIEKGVKFAKGE